MAQHSYVNIFYEEQIKKKDLFHKINSKREKNQDE